MALTTEQEKYLADFADKGIAEQADIEARTAKDIKDAEVAVAREAKLAELKAQADELIATGLQEFEATIEATQVVK